MPPHPAQCPDCREIDALDRAILSLSLSLRGGHTVYTRTVIYPATQVFGVARRRKGGVCGDERPLKINTHDS